MSEKNVLDALIREYLHYFVQKVFLTVVPGVTFQDNWHIQALAYQLQRCARGEVKRLLITIPPRHLKSLSVSVAFVAWILGHDPTRRIVCASYSQDLSSKHAIDTRTVMESPWYQRCFPNCRLNPQRNTLAELMTTRQGYRLATSVGGTLTGRGGNIIIIDDPHKADEVESQSQRQGVIDWYRNTVVSRSDNPQDDVFIVIQQRLHAEDLAGYLLETGGWFHLNLPAIAENDEIIAIGEGEYHRRSRGELLHPDRLPQSLLDRLREEMGSLRFAAQYQQTPVPLGGGIVKWPWFKFYSGIPTPTDDGMLIQSWDTATKAGEANDYSVCTTWLIAHNQCHLLDLYRERLEFPELRRQIIDQARKWHADGILIEDVGAGTALWQDLKATANELSVIPIQPKGDKASRLLSASPIIEAGRVLLPEEAPWLAEFRRKITLFPKGKHDDQVDSVSQFLEWFRDRDNQALEGDKLLSQVREYSRRAQGSRASQVYGWVAQHSHPDRRRDYFNFYG